MALLWVPLVLWLQFLMGRGLLRRLHVRLPQPQAIALAVLAGLPLSSLVALFLDLVGIHITLLSVLCGFAGAAAALNGPWHGARGDARATASSAARLRACEWPFVAFFVGIAAISVWRAFYLPVTFRDALLGLDLVAKYAAAQGTLHSTVFTDPWLHGHLSNQPFRAPFPVLMQVVFRLAGLPFGQLWLSALFLAFLVFCYSRFRERVHPLIAGLVMTLLLASREMYAHTFMVSNDYATAVFFGAAVVFFLDYDRRPQSGSLLLSALFMGFACWTRSDTMLFVPPGAVLAALSAKGADRAGLRAPWSAGAVFLAIPAAFVLLWHGLYLGRVLHQSPEGLGGIGPISALALPGDFYRTAWLFGQTSVYGYLPLVFFALALVNLVFLRDRGPRALWFWLAFLYLGLTLMLFVAPVTTLENTLKRGYFKFLPIMALYLVESRALQTASERIRRWESAPGPAWPRWMWNRQ